MNTAINTTKTLHDNAMLVTFNVSQWTGRKYDKKVSEKVELDYNAIDAGRYNKILIAQEAIKKVNKTAGAARTFHYENTLPWDDNGARILPAANYLEYTKGMRELKAVFEAAAAELVANYGALVDEARIRLNGMFNQADYPDSYDIARKYDFKVKVNPLPAADDFRVNLNSGERDKIKSEIEARALEGQAAAMKDLWNRLHGAIKNMADKLRIENAIFRDSLINNLCELCNLLPRLNMTNDPALEDMRKEVESALCEYDPNELREDKETRKAAAAAAADLMNKMSGYMGV